MTFTAALALWREWKDKTAVGSLVFCDWVQERGMSAYYTENWRKSCRMYGGTHIESELVRLSQAEAKAATG